MEKKEEQHRSRWKCTVAYDGTSYHGFQYQPKEASVQEQIEKALTRIHKAPVTIFGSGRTDGGVHAQGQVFHFDSSLQLRPNDWLRAINTYLPLDIRIREVEEATLDFHARYDARKKEYRYQIYRSPLEDPMKRLYWMHIRYSLDVEQMRKAAELFLGEHDFTGFSSSKSAVKSRVRTIYRLEIEQRELEDGDELILICEGNGFLYNMVRIIAGTLIDVGRGRRSLEQVKRALVEKNRAFAGKLAPAHGLFLWRVDY